jgi:hypothetical protein
MKNQEKPFADQLLGQESVDLNLKAGYEKRVLDMVYGKVGWLTRTFYIVAALIGIVFSISLVVEIFEPMCNQDLMVIVKGSLICLFLCVAFYTCLAAAAAIRGNVPLGAAMPIVLGAVILSGFFVCLWLFMTFILPIVYEYSQHTAEVFPAKNAWIVGLVCMVIIFALFGVLAAGITFILHLLYKHHGQNRQKLLEIELAIVELAEKKAGPAVSN